MVGPYDFHYEFPILYDKNHSCVIGKYELRPKNLTIFSLTLFLFSEFDMEQFQAEQAALKIQAAFRGHRARKMMAAKRREKNGELNCIELS